MLKLISICFAALVFLQAPLSVAQSAPLKIAGEQGLAARLDATIGSHYKANEPGATVIVVKDGKTVLRKAYGLANLEKKLPLNADMSLRLGSVTKQFTAVSILMLAEEGKLSLSDEITKFLPDYPTHGTKITIKHLLSHTSGIVDYTNKPDYVGNSTKDMSVSQMIDGFKNDELQFEPGSRWSYSNSGFFLLGAIIEKLSGQPYARFVEQRIFVPLGMTQTAYEGHERMAAQKAIGYSRAASGYEPSAPLSMTQPYAAGSLVSTVDDLARWDAAISAGKLLTPASWQLAFTSYKLPSGAPNTYGYGWNATKLQGSPMMSHGGDINGFGSFVLRIPNEKVFVAVLSNADSGIAHPEMVAFKAGAIAIGKPYPDPKAIKLDAKVLDQFVGEYKVDATSNRIIRRDHDRLTLQRTGNRIVPLTAYSNTGFFIENTLTWIEFSKNAKGEVTQLTITQNDKVQSSPRISGTTPER